MKHKLIKTENYLLVLDDSKIKVNDWVYSIDGVHQWFGLILKTEPLPKKIIAHLPLNNSPILQGVDLLPPLEQEDDVEKLALTIFPRHENWTLNSDNSDKRPIWIGGYNKAKEKYNADLGELLSDFYLFATNGEVCDHEVINEFIQSLQQPKTPVGFECEWTTKQMPEFHQDEPKTTTNLRGQTVLVGKYIY